jgi:predicted transcriptional regulator of viral defense system
VSEGVPSAALRLIQRLLEVAPGGRVFTSHDAVASGAEVGLTAEHTYKLLSQLVDRGLLERPRGRLYVLKPPFGGIVPVRPLVIAVQAVAPAAVSGDTALVHWGLLSQAPLHEEVVSSPARIQWSRGVRADGADRLWSVDGATIRFHHVPSREMFGIRSVHLDSETVVPMFDRERSLVELLTRSEPDGAEWAAELVRERGGDIDRARLKQYVERLSAGRPPTFAPLGRNRRAPVGVTA